MFMAGLAWLVHDGPGWFVCHEHGADGISGMVT
jgi:hypothetical protein